MSETRHWMIRLQRENARRPLTYARKELTGPSGTEIVGEEMRDEKGLVARTELRSNQRFERSLKKREASRTTRQRRLMARAFAVELILARLEHEGHDTVLHPDNPHVPLSLRRKLRKQGKGKILTGKPRSRIIVPGQKGAA